MANNPFLSSPGGGVDLFGGADPAAIQTQPTNAMDDLLQLGNPFADMFGAQPPAPVQQNNQWMNGETMFNVVICATVSREMIRMNFEKFVEKSFYFWLSSVL